MPSSRQSPFRPTCLLASCHSFAAAWPGRRTARTERPSRGVSMEEWDLRQGPNTLIITMHVLDLNILKVAFGTTPGEVALSGALLSSGVLLTCQLFP